MREYLPIIIVGAIIGAFTVAFVFAYIALQRSKKVLSDHRNIPDSEIVGRLMGYAWPYWKDFAMVLAIMVVSVVYDVVSPLLIGEIQNLIKADFEMSRLLSMVLVYALMLVVSMLCTYFQAMILQKTARRF